MEQDKENVQLFNYLIWIEIAVLFICVASLLAIWLVGGSKSENAPFELWIVDLSIALKIVCTAGITLLAIIATIVINMAYTKKQSLF